jgi:hypothetical protein
MSLSVKDVFFNIGPLNWAVHTSQASSSPIIHVITS